jgi:hypothetical protein
MKYALLIYPARDSYDELPDDARQAVFREYVELATSPGVLGSEQLEPDTATTVRAADGRTLVTDGPFADTKEAIGGFYLLDAAGLDEALEFAGRMPAVRLGGAIEVHRVVER